MSRTRYRTRQLEHDVRSSPVHWTRQPGNRSDEDEDQSDGVERSSTRIVKSRDVRSSPVHWSDQSDDRFDKDEDQGDGVECSPTRVVESEKFEAEDQERYVDYEAAGRTQYLEARQRSPVLNRRPINKYDPATDEYRTHRAISEAHHSDYFPVVQNDSHFKHESMYKPESYQQRRTSQTPQVQVKDSVYRTKYMVSMIVLVFIGFLILIQFIPKPSVEISYTDSEDMTGAVRKALSRFENISGDVVFQFSAGIRNILESDPTKPSIFVILHNNTSDGPFCLANVIGNLAMKYLESDEEGPLILKPDDLLKNENISEDYGWIIENYKSRVEKHRTVIVSDLQKFPGRMAMVFHFFCDVYSPVVPKSLFVFTMHVTDVYSKKNVKNVEQAETAMHNLWRHEVNDDQRQALITRLTEDVITLPANIVHGKSCM